MAPGPPLRRRPGPRKSRVNGVEVPYDPELEVDKDRPKPTPLFPDYSPSRARPLTESEKRQIHHFRHLRNCIHSGPLYTALADGFRVGKSGGSVSMKATFNAFEGMPKYSQRYTKKKRAVPKLDTRPYVLEFFPKELRSTLDPKATEVKGVVETSTKGRSLQIPRYDKLEELVVDHDMSEDDNNRDDENIGPRLAKKTGGAEEEDEEQGLEGEDVEDDEFDDDEDAGDYNAEQYFDDGGDDGGGGGGEDYDAGGEGSGYFD